MNSLSNELLAQVFAQNSDDPFLALITLSHDDFDEDIRLVNNTKDFVSRGNNYIAFPVRIRFPVDDGESARDFTIDFDNASLEMIQQIRSVTDRINVKIEMVLASLPDVVQIAQEDLVIATLSYNSRTIQAKIILDSFLNVEVTSERYTPTNFPGMF